MNAVREPSRGVPLGALVAAAAAGAVVLVVEFAVVRVGAPWFGQSVLVWSNVVGVVLAALALGYAIGGRWAARGADAAALVGLFAFSGVWLALASRWAGPLAAWLVPAGSGEDRPLVFAFTASLAAATWLAGPPALALAAVTPILVRRLTPRWGAGRAAGFVGAAGTLGSLLGAALTPLVLLPSSGARESLAWGGLACGLAALGWAAVGGPGRRRADPVPAPTGESRTSRRALAVALLVGLVITVVEFSASRALTPRLGGGQASWAALVGVVLGALALGNALGGRWAARGEATARRARAGLVLAALGVVGSTFALEAVTRAFAPRILDAGSGPALSSGGVFPAAFLLYGVPVFLLGTTSPILVRGLSRVRGSGAAAGSVFAAGTVGSVLGCWITPILLLPSFGIRATLWGSAAAVLGAALLWPSSRRVPQEAGESTAAGPAGPEGTAQAEEASGAAPRRGVTLGASLLACALPGVALLVPLGALREDPGQLVEVETRYQTVRVIEGSEEAPRPGPYPLYGVFAPLPQRFLRFDEDFTAYQSVRVLEDEAQILTAGRYYDHLALGAWFEGMPWTSEPARAPRVLVLGSAGGTLHRILDLVAPEGGPLAEVTGVELDPAVPELARRHLGGVPSSGRLFAGEDGRAVLEALPLDPPFDLVFVDAYQRTQYVPFQLATLEFFRACAARLAPSGALGVNLHAPRGLEGALLRGIARTLAVALGPNGRVWLVPNPQYPASIVVWGTARAQAPRVGGGSPPSLAGAAHALDRLLVRAPDGGAGLVLTDDHAPVERLSEDALLPEPRR